MQKVVLFAAAVAVSGAALAIAPGEPLGNETVTYAYDALGRLSGSTISGGPNNTRTTGSCFDGAGNRMRYDVATSAPSTCPTPSPTPTPAP
jgi:YD repeat-containing protein